MLPTFAATKAVTEPILSFFANLLKVFVECVTFLAFQHVLNSINVYFAFVEWADD